MRSYLQKIITLLAGVGISCLAILVISSCESGKRNDHSLASVPFFETTQSLETEPSLAVKPLTSPMTNNSAPHPLSTSVYDLVETLKLKGLPKTTQIIIRKAMKKILRENKYLATSTLNKFPPKIMLAGEVSVSEKRSDILWLKFDWELRELSGEKLSRRSRQVVVDSRHWKDSTPEAVNLVIDATSPDVIMLVREYLEETSEQNSQNDENRPADSARKLADTHISKKRSLGASPQLMHSAPYTKRQNNSEYKKYYPNKVGSLSFFVYPVSGATGNGNVVLTTALKLALQQRDNLIADTVKDANFSVQGIVHISSTKQNKQDIRIVWTVSNNNGRELGKAIQENSVLEESLHNGWSKIADLISEAAVQGIKKLCDTRDTNAGPTSLLN
ncbi:MAG: hypothetical protein CMF70_10395 [Magnetovibrio sp.]|nr:hypothetical protein [Magnetovibrio sp.]|tara:strand:- start:172 stop:1335 length:1164 start_codon:yes stop_codon:yes gene_type:complete